MAGRGSDSVRGPLGYIRAGRRALGGCRRRAGLGQAAKRSVRRRNAAGEARRRRDSQHCQHEHGRLRARALLALKLGRQPTGGATSAPREFQRGTSSGLPSAWSVLRAAGHSNGGGATVRATTRSRRCLLAIGWPVRWWTWLRLGRQADGLETDWHPGSGGPVAVECAWLSSASAGLACCRTATTWNASVTVWQRR